MIASTKAKPGLQGAIEAVYDVIAANEPITARDIERHPTVVATCRSSKLKARRLVERLHKLGHIQSDGAAQMPKFSTVKG